MADKDDIIEINPYTIKYDTKTGRFLKKGVLPKLGWGALTSTAIFAGLAVATVATGGLALGAGAATAAVVAGNVASVSIAGGATAQALYSGIMYRSRLSKARFDKLGLERTIDLIKEMEEDCVVYREKLQELEAIDDKTVSVKGVSMNKRQLKSAIKEREDQVHHGLRYLYDVGIKCSKRINYLDSKVILTEDELSTKAGQQAQLSLIHSCTKEICSHFTEGFNPYKGLIVRALENGCLLGTDEQNSKIRNLNQHPDSSRAFNLFHEMYEKDAFAEKEEYKSRAEAMKLKPECERLLSLIKETVKHKELSDATKTLLNEASDNLKASVDSLYYQEMKFAITKAKEALIIANKEIVSYHQTKGRTSAEVIQEARDEYKKYSKFMASSINLGIVGPEKWAETAQEIKNLINKYEDGKSIDVDKLIELVEALQGQNQEYIEEASTIKLASNIKAAKEKAHDVITRFEAVSYPNTKRPISTKQADVIKNIRELCAKKDISQEELETLKGLTSSLEKVTTQREQLVKEDAAYELGKKSTDNRTQRKFNEIEQQLKDTKAELGRTRKRVVEAKKQGQQMTEQAATLRAQNTRLNFDLHQAQMLSEDESGAREYAEGVAYDEFVGRKMAEGTATRNFINLLSAQAELQEAQRRGADYAYEAHLAQQRAQTAEENLEQVHTTIDELVAEKARAEARAEGISTTLSKVASRQRTGNKANAKLTKKVGKLQGQVDELEGQVDAARDVAYEEHVARVSAEEQREVAQGIAYEEHEARIIEADEARENIANLNRVNANDEVVINSLIAQLTQSNAELRDAVSPERKMEAARVIRAKSQQIAQAQKELSETQLKLAAARRSSVKKGNKIKKLEKEVDAKTAELDALTERFGETVADAYDLSVENDTLYSSAVQADEARKAESIKRQKAEDSRRNAEFGRLVESRRREKAEGVARVAQKAEQQANEDAKYARAERDTAILSRQNAERRVEELTSSVKGMDEQLTAALDSSRKLEEELAYTQRANEALTQDNANLTNATIDDAYRIAELTRAIAEQDEALLGYERDIITRNSNRDIASEQRRLKDSINKIIAHMDYVSSAKNPVYNAQIEKTWSELDIVLSQIADERLKYADAEDIKQKRMLLEQLYKDHSSSWPKMPREYETKKTVKKLEDKMGLNF